MFTDKPRFLQLTIVGISMNITVTARIGGGFALLVLLLLAISVTSFRSLSLVEQQLATTTEKITPIILRSAEMSVSLLSSNKAVLLFMNAREEQELKTQRSSFETQQKNYQNQKAQLLTLASQYQPITSILEPLNIQVESYFGTALNALSQHRHNLQLQLQLTEAALALQNEIRFFKADMESLIIYGLPEEQSAGRELKTNLAAIESEFKQLLEASEVDQLKAIEASFATRGYGFSLLGMQSRLQKLIDGGSEIAADLNKYMDTLILAATAEDGVARLKSKQLESINLLNLMVSQLSANANTSSEALDQLMRGAQTIAADVKRDTEQQVKQSQLTNIIISVISVLLAIVIGVWVSRYIRNSLKRVVSILRVIADGDLSQRIETINKDEFGQLATYVNELANRQEQVIRQIHSAADDIDNSAIEASSVSIRTNQMMNEQQQQTIQVAAAIQQLSTTVANVAENAESAQQEVQQINDSAQQNRILMEKNVEQVTLLASEIDRSSGVINQLHNDTVDIGKILVTIQGIAGQTNLLALNAAIEAARAGEQGRGFAVVADEVRTLASRTQNSTKEIQSMIESLQKGARNAVDLMDSSKSQAQASLEQTNVAGESLLSMVQQLEQVKQTSMEIAAAAEQQTVVSLEISESVQQIASAAELGAEEAQNSARGSEQLAELAKMQKSIVSKFTIS